MAWIFVVIWLERIEAAVLPTVYVLPFLLLVNLILACRLLRKGKSRCRWVWAGWAAPGYNQPDHQRQRGDDSTRQRPVSALLRNRQR